MGDKLFEQHERDRKAAEGASKRYQDSLKDGGKGKEPDNVGNASKQNAQVRREAGKK